MSLLLHKQSAALSVPPPKGSPYSVALPGTEQPGRSPVYRHWRFTENLQQSIDPAVTTVHEAFEQAATTFPNKDCLGARKYDPVKKVWGPYEWISYSQVQMRRANFGLGLVELHRQIGVMGAQYGVGLWCQNRPEWQISDLACMSQSLYSVSIYDTLGPDTTEYIINHASLSCVISSLAHIPTLLKLAPRLPTLKLIICLEPLSSPNDNPNGLDSKQHLLNSVVKDMNLDVQVIDMAAVEALGAAHPRPLNPPRPADIVTINYTSGTTGNPKGVVLTHSNAVAAASAFLTFEQTGTTDTGISYLPLAHIYQRVNENVALWAGARMGYFHGNVLELVDDLKELKPTVFQSVPRLWNRFGAAVKAATVMSDGFKGKLSRHVVDVKTAAINRKDDPSSHHFLYDRIWGRKVSAALGLERARALVTGSAPLDPGLQQFLRIVTGANFPQGYGLTETYALGLCQLRGDLSAGNCGAVAPCIEVCLKDVPDMEYLHTDKPHPRGELLMRGPSRFQGYLSNTEETDKAIDADGWFSTGDICSVDELGRFKIIDRKKNVLKLAQGEYISPERIENVLLANLPWMAQAYVHGDSHQNSLVAIVGVDPVAFGAFAGKVTGKAVAEGDLDAVRALCKDQKVRSAVTREFEKVGRKQKFNSYEHVKKAELMLDPFTIDNELLTPTLKLKRPPTAKKYRSVLDSLYEEVVADEAKAPIRHKL